MGNLTTKAVKQERLSIRASETEKLTLAKAAQARRMNTSQFVLQASLDAAELILRDQMEIVLGPEQWDEFQRRLDEPARSIPELQKLFSRPSRFDA